MNDNKSPAEAVALQGMPVVSCVLAIDGGDKMAKEWPKVASGYIPALLRSVDLSSFFGCTTTL